MTDRSYVTRFSEMGFGLFVHFGLYSLLNKGEWALEFDKIPHKEYDKLLNKFKVSKNFAKEIAGYAKKAGCKYITLTSRHHDGFSLYDTKGLSEYDVMHTPTKRDIIREFTDECHKAGIKPFFYHTLMDWTEKTYKEDFDSYLNYLRESIKLLCTEYGEIGGFWFDGMWDKPAHLWQEDKLYGVIRKYQPEAMIINNTGLSFQGKVGHPEIDSVTFERGKPAYVDNSDRIRGGEMCQIMNNNWGCSDTDIAYHSVGEFIKDLTDCRKFNCNYLLNVGPEKNGLLGNIEKGILEKISKWTAVYGESIYKVKPTGISDKDDFVLKGENCDYLFVHGLEMVADENVNIVVHGAKEINLKLNGKVKSIKWLDNNKNVYYEMNGGEYKIKADNFPYGTNWCIRVARIDYEN